MSSLDILGHLIGFPSITDGSNRAIASFIAEHLRGRGIEADGVGSDDKVNLLATLGPRTGAGVILSGHMDVVPTEGQRWTSDPFRLAERDGRLYGRGTADMKGFLACMLSLADRLPVDRLTRPIHLCFSHDEEIGCVGVRSLLDRLARSSLDASLCVVGEPTGLRLMTGHKGKLAATATCHGLATHSALAPRALNAIHLAAEFIGVLRSEQGRLEASGARDAAYDIPFSTVHAGVIAGGTALNIVPDRCTVAFEIRTVASDDPEGILARIARQAVQIAGAAQVLFPEAAITIEIVNAYPGLDTPVDSDAVTFMSDLLDAPGTGKVAFGTEGGLFSARLGVPTVICGPGSMEQGHKADEFITRDQLDRCDRMLDRLAESLSA